MDEALPEELSPLARTERSNGVDIWRASCEKRNSPASSTTRPSTSTGTVVQEDGTHPVKTASAAVEAPRRSIELSREQQLLLGGEPFGQALVTPRPRSSGSAVSSKPAETSKV